jgi:isochorismate hydrolase
MPKRKMSQTPNRGYMLVHDVATYFEEKLNMNTFHHYRSEGFSTK